MEYIVRFYDVGNQCVDIQQFIVESLEELNEKAEKYANVLVNDGWEIAGWDYWDIEDSF